MRKSLDAYYTPDKAVLELKKHLTALDKFEIWEPCVGTGNISRHFVHVRTMDIDPKVESNHTSNMTIAGNWDLIASQYGRPDFVVTNPPFAQAFYILKNAYEFSRSGCAMLLRLSFLEPTFERSQWLHDHPPSMLIVLPRISFTNDGKTDLVTCAWMVWFKDMDIMEIQPQIHIVLKEKGK